MRPADDTTSPSVLTKALVRAAGQLGLTDDLSAMLRIESAEAEQLRTGARMLNPQAEEWGLALKLVRLYRTLLEVLGALERARDWLTTPHDVLHPTPRAVLRTEQADRVLRYVDAVARNEIRMPPPQR